MCGSCTPCLCIVLMHAHVELMHAQALMCARTHTPQVLPVHMYGGHGLEGFAQTTILNLEGQLSHRPAPSAIADFNSAAMLFFFFGAGNERLWLHALIAAFIAIQINGMVYQLKCVASQVRCGYGLDA